MTVTHVAHLELLMVVAVLDHYEAQVKALGEVEQVVRLGLGPSVVVEMLLILLFRVHWNLH